MPANVVPFLGTALSRAREYTCDRIAQELVPEGAVMGLVALAAGTKLYRRINLKALYAQQDAEWNFWTWFSEVQSSHPNLINRIRTLDQYIALRLGLGIDVSSHTDTLPTGDHSGVTVRCKYTFEDRPFSGPALSGKRRFHVDSQCRHHRLGDVHRERC